MCEKPFKIHRKIYNMVSEEMSLLTSEDSDLDIVESIIESAVESIEELMEYEGIKLKDIDIKEEIDKAFDLFISNLEMECDLDI